MAGDDEEIDFDDAHADWAPRANDHLIEPFFGAFESEPELTSGGWLARLLQRLGKGREPEDV